MCGVPTVESTPARRAAPIMLVRPTSSSWQAGGVADLDRLQADLRAFSDERDWRQFHDPKSLILALVGEVGELAELYQWLPASDATELGAGEPLHTRTAEEIADVLIYLLVLADSLGIDLVDAATRKLAAARSRFPAETHHGVAPQKH
jgi:dCTP diphosphatase